ncbi:acyl-CoA desaturase [Verrucomicrobia bacterium LW23]|nr:acyl-CoA desaturase [Verrucomicrobia bacterium LW23]
MTKDYKFTWAGFLFVLVHLTCLAVFWVGITWTAAFLCLFMFVLRKFGITGGYHRYFSHRSYRTSRFFQFCLAFIGGMSAQKGALWWAAHHRHHHKHSDTEEDLHSAKLEGFVWSHVGWVLSNEYDEYDSKAVTDLTKFPELVFLDKYHFIPPVVAAVACFLIGGWVGLLWGFFVSTVILYHTTFAINSLCHMFGSQRYATGEASKNSLWLAIVTMGEGWHNNHHHYQLSARQGFFWWEVDITYYILLTLNKLGIIWDIKHPPAKLLKPEAMIPSARAAVGGAVEPEPQIARAA